MASIRINAIPKIAITPEGQSQADSNPQHTRQDMSISEGEVVVFEWYTRTSEASHDEKNYIDTTENSGKLLDTAKIYRPHA
jgi:hypothetical protein